MALAYIDPAAGSCSSTPANRFIWWDKANLHGTHKGSRIIDVTEKVQAATSHDTFPHYRERL